MMLPLLMSVLLMACMSLSQAGTVKQMNELKRTLLKDYDKHTIPFDHDHHDEFSMRMYIHPIAIANLDEIDEKLSAVLAFVMIWNDTSIQWDPEEHHNISHLTFGLDEVWRPGVMLQNPHQQDFQTQQDKSTTALSYTPSGETIWEHMVTLHTTCDIHTTYFPLDVQKCDIDLFIGNDFQHFIDIDVKWTDKKFFKGNGAWDIVSKDIEQFASHIRLSFAFARKPMFMMLNILLPMLVLATLSPLVFLMSKGSSERLGFSITMLLALSVYMTIINEHLPENSEPLPLVSVMIFVWYILTALIVVIVVFNIKISRINERRKIPKCTRAFVKLTRYITRRKTLTFTGISKEDEQCLDSKSEALDEDECHVTEVKITWVEVSVAIDKWCFVIFYVIKFVVPAVFISVISS